MAETVQHFILITEKNREQVVRTIKKLILRRKSEWLSQLLGKLHASDLTHIWNYFSTVEKSQILNNLKEEDSAAFLAELDPKLSAAILRTQDTEWIVDRLEELDPDDSVDILKTLSDWEADFIIRRFDAEYSKKIKELLHYPEETAGALMTSDFIAVSQKASVETIIKQFRKESQKNQFEDLHFIYIVNEKTHLVGYIPLRKLIIEKPGKLAKDIMKPLPVLVRPETDQEEVAKLFRDYDLISAPVVNEDNILLGRITIDDIVDVLEEEASEDVYRMFGLNKKEKFSNGILLSLRHRLPWMFINIATTTISALVIGLYQGLIQEFVVLAMFMPMVAALGGATGNQMVAMVVRGLALGKLHWVQIRWVLFRDVTAVILGAILVGSLISIVAHLLYNNYLLGMIVAIALLLNMVFATIMGAAIPLLLKFFKMDPAYGSSILVAASTDIMGFFIFLALASEIFL
ncbi:MAG: magnesium transporter [Leptospirales bacterium]